MSGYKIGMAEEAVIADLTAKLAECKAQKEAALRIAEQHSDVVNNMIQQLTESQAREARLLDLAQWLSGCCDLAGYNGYNYWEQNRHILAEQSNDTALKEYRKKVLLSAANELSDTYPHLTVSANLLRRIAEE